LAAPDPTSPDPSLEGIGYADAVAELEDILEQLDGDEIDVDHLAAQVRRAAELIALCRSRLSSARMEVTRIVADLDGASALAGTEPGEAAPSIDGSEGAGQDADDDEDDELESELEDDLARDDR
jgi:exodeoxyribonuclease VII small subunit